MTQKPDETVSITSAHESHSADLRRREHRYLFSMGIRTVCFLLAVFTPSPWRWVFVAGALILPYIAVVIANASNVRDGANPASFTDRELPRLTTSDEPEPMPHGAHPDRP